MSILGSSNNLEKPFMQKAGTAFHSMENYLDEDQLWSPLPNAHIAFST